MSEARQERVTADDGEDETMDEAVRDLTRFIRSRATRQPRSRSARRQPSMDDVLESALQVINQREGDILKAVEFGQGLLTEIAELQARKRQLEAHRDLAPANKRQSLQNQQVHMTVKTLEEAVATKDVDIQQKDAALKRLKEQLAAARHECSESDTEIKLLRAENNSLQRLMAQQSRRRGSETSSDGSSECANDEESTALQAHPCSPSNVEKIERYESEIEGLKERLHAAERQLEDEQRQVANLQALQALEGSWQTSGNVLDLQERIEELQRQNGALELDQISKLAQIQRGQQGQMAALKALKAERDSLRKEVTDTQAAYLRDLRPLTEYITLLSTQLQGVESGLSDERRRQLDTVVKLQCDRIQKRFPPAEWPLGRRAKKAKVQMVIPQRSPRYGTNSPRMQLERMIEQKSPRLTADISMPKSEEKKLPPRALSSPRITSPRILNSEGANGKPPMPIIPSLGSLEGLPRPSVDLASVSPRVESARDATEAEADLRAQVVETKDQLLTTQQALRLAEAKVRRYEERLDQFTSTAYASVERLTKTKNALKLVEELNSRLREERNTLQESLNAVMDQSATSHAQADVGSDGSSAQDTAQRTTPRGPGAGPQIAVLPATPDLQTAMLKDHLATVLGSGAEGQPEAQKRCERLLRDKPKFQSLLQQFGNHLEECPKCRAGNDECNDFNFSWVGSPGASEVGETSFCSNTSLNVSAFINDICAMPSVLDMSNADIPMASPRMSGCAPTSPALHSKPPLSPRLSGAAMTFPPEPSAPSAASAVRARPSSEPSPAGPGRMGPPPTTKSTTPPRKGLRTSVSPTKQVPSPLQDVTNTAGRDTPSKKGRRGSGSPTKQVPGAVADTANTAVPAADAPAKKAPGVVPSFKNLFGSLTRGRASP